MIRTPTCDQAPGLRERKKTATRRAIHSTALRLVGERGVAAVTVEEISAEVDIAPRTFFNYYPSKVAAVFDLRAVEIAPEDGAAYVTGSGSLVADTCELAARHISLPTDYADIKSVLVDQPELRSEFWVSMIALLKPMFPLLVQRTGDQHTARATFGLILAALGAAVTRSDAEASVTLAERLLTEVRGMRDLLNDVPL